MQWYLEALRKYAVFSGRSRRTEYWLFTLFNFLISIALFLIMCIPGLGFLGIPMFLYQLGIIVPGLAVCVRRLHDTDRSGWWVLLCLIPLVGTIILIVWFAQEGSPGANRFGPNPKMSPAISPQPATA